MREFICAYFQSCPS